MAKNFNQDEVDSNLKKLHIRSKTFFFHKYRKMSDVISDIACKWNTYTPEEQKLVYDMFGFQNFNFSNKNCGNKEENK